jgi:butyryl-CoA:acetate CoA-transferase
MSFVDEYRRKVITAEEAAALIKSNMIVDYGPWTLFPTKFDRALGKRAGEPGLEHVNIRGASTYVIPEIFKNDPDAVSFNYGVWYFSGLDRKMAEYARGEPHYVSNYHEVPYAVKKEGLKHKWPDVFALQARPMDKHGFFNFGAGNSHAKDALEHAKYTVLEVNENLPNCYGGFGEGVNLNEVDYIIEEGEAEKLILAPPPGIPTPEELEIAKLIIPDIRNGSCLQLGIGNLPNTIGVLLAESDLKELGIHSEMFCEAFVKMHRAGKITNRYKAVDRYKSTYTFAMGTQDMFDFMDNNPNLASCPVDYLNDPACIRLNPNMVAINNLLEVDLFTQVCSETSGIRHISGSGGQLDFAIGAYESEGGNSFLCFNSVYKDKDGNKHSRVVPTLTPGAVVTTPRTIVHWLVTEYGKVNVKGMSTWERAEAIISIAHPDFRDQLIQDAEKMGIWHPSNKIR